MSVKIIKFEIVTPEKVVLKRDILQISVPTTSGEITVLPNHIPLISILKSGVIELKLTDASVKIISVSEGFIEVMKDKVVILVDTAERAEDIDEERLKKAYSRAKELRQSAEIRDEERFVQLSARIERELARTKALKRWRRIKADKNN